MMSALEVALSHGHQSIAEILVRAGSNLLRYDGNGHQALAMQLYFTNAALLHAHEATCKPSEHDAVEEHILACMTNLLRGQPSIGMVDRKPVVVPLRRRPELQRRRSHGAELTHHGAANNPDTPEIAFHFGQPLRLCQSTVVSGYDVPIPSVLV